MAEVQREFVIRRILVALGASSRDRDALEVATSLAARFQAEVFGIFVEDENLFRLAELPFGREVGQSSAIQRRLDVNRMAQSMKNQARRLDEDLAKAGATHSVRVHLRVVRGDVVREVLEAAREADLLIVGKRESPSRTERRIGRHVRRIVTQMWSNTPVLVFEEADLGRPVIVLFDGTEQGYRALGTAAEFARGGEEPLRVVLPAGPGSGEYESLQRLARLWLERQGVEACYLSLTPVNSDTVARLVHAQQGRVLVVEAGCVRGGKPELAELLACLRCSLVVV